MPFGLTNAPSVFQRLMDTVLVGCPEANDTVLVGCPEANGHCAGGVSRG